MLLWRVWISSCEADQWCVLQARSWSGCCEGRTSPFPAPAAPSCNEYVRCQSVFEFLPNSGGGGTEKSIEAMMGDPKLWNTPVCVF